MLKHGKAPVSTIFVHQATTRPEWKENEPVEAKRDEIRKWHKARGWSDIGYHYVIDRDGTIATGRPESRIGAHVRGHNTGSIGICLIGGHGASKTDEFSDHFTEDQDIALRNLIDNIKTRADIKRVRGHSDVANKACPGFTVATWLQGPAAPEIVNHHMANSTKAQAAKCGQWVGGGMLGAGISYEAAKYGLGEANTIISMINTLISQVGWIVVPAIAGALWAVSGWLRNKQKEDIKEGRYESSVPMEGT